MKTLTVNSNNDLTLNNGHLSVSTAIQAVLYACQHAVKAQYGEMIYAIDRGIPYNVIVWSGNPNLIQLEAFIRRTILNINEVNSLSDFEITAHNSTISYSVTIHTTYGTGTLDDVRISN